MQDLSSAFELDDLNPQVQSWRLTAMQGEGQGFIVFGVTQSHEQTFYHQTSEPAKGPQLPSAHSGRHGRDSNPQSSVYETDTLPLGHRAWCGGDTLEVCSGCFPNWRSTGIFKTLQPSLGCVGKNNFHYVEGGRSGWANWLETIEKQQELRQPKLCRRASMNTQHLQPESRATMHRR